MQRQCNGCNAEPVAYRCTADATEWCSLPCHMFWTSIGADVRLATSSSYPITGSGIVMEWWVSLVRWAVELRQRLGADQAPRLLTLLRQDIELAVAKWDAVINRLGAPQEFATLSEPLVEFIEDAMRGQKTVPSAEGVRYSNTVAAYFRSFNDDRLSVVGKRSFTRIRACWVTLTGSNVDVRRRGFTDKKALRELRTCTEYVKELGAAVDAALAARRVTIGAAAPAYAEGITWEQSLQELTQMLVRRAEAGETRRSALVDVIESDILLQGQYWHTFNPLYSREQYRALMSKLLEFAKAAQTRSANELRTLERQLLVDKMGMPALLDPVYKQWNAWIEALQQRLKQSKSVSPKKLLRTANALAKAFAKSSQKA